ncbi:MAG: hypothetical protein M3492_13945, partial [Actinomycetota bacterium]|nr:hypothetical protein [Actinomycetota bacterium]
AWGPDNRESRNQVVTMTTAGILVAAVLGLLVIGWLTLSYFIPMYRQRPGGQSYQTQHTENPEYFPGHGVGARSARTAVSGSAG